MYIIKTFTSYLLEGGSNANIFHAWFLIQKKKNYPLIVLFHHKV